MADPSTPSPSNPILFLDNACDSVIKFRQKPLLVLFYPPSARMSEDDLNDVYSAFRKEKVVPEQKLPTVDVLIESYGGDPVAGYRLAQLIRDFADEVKFLVPSHAYSAATILCFSGNEIRLGHFAGLSPIDITLVSESSEKPGEEVELASVDSFTDFAVRAREKVDQLLKRTGSNDKTQVDSDLLVTMVKEIGALNVGKYFRERTLTGHYAQVLLDTYMLPNFLDGEDRRISLINNFLFTAPSHSFHLDYHLCAKWGLVVKEMGTQESDATKRVVDVLERLASSGIICPNVSRVGKVPFVRFYPLTTQATLPLDAQSNEESNHETEKDAKS